MSQLSSNSAVGTYASDYSYRANQAKTEKTEKAESTEKKSRVYGRTIGKPELSEKAQKYYEQLKKKYSNMDFVLVSTDMKEQAERNKGMYASSKELLVLIDEEKLERMAADEEYRAKYEGILNNAASQIGQMKTQLGANADKVSSVGMSFDDNGNASFFAVVDKSLAKQRERIEEKKEAAKEEKKKAQKEADKERAEDKRADKSDRREEAGWRKDGDYETVTASSFEELLKKIDGVLQDARTNLVMTEAEKKVGQTFDYSV